MDRPRREPHWLTQVPMMRRLSVAFVVLMTLCVFFAAAIPGIWAKATGAMLGGVALVVLISGAFYAVGLSEDRERSGRD